MAGRRRRWPTATRRRGSSPPVPVAVAVVLAGAVLLLGACAGGTDVVVDPPAGAVTGTGEPDASSAGPAAARHGDGDGDADSGRRLAVERNCVSCHSADGSAGVGPTWRGLYGSTERLVDGRAVEVDDDYLARSIREPGAEVVVGFDVVEMPAIELGPAEIDDLLAYIRSLS